MDKNYITQEHAAGGAKDGSVTPKRNKTLAMKKDVGLSVRQDRPGTTA